VNDGVDVPNRSRFQPGFLTAALPPGREQVRVELVQRYPIDGLESKMAKVWDNVMAKVPFVAFPGRLGEVRPSAR